MAPSRDKGQKESGKYISLNLYTGWRSEIGTNVQTENLITKLYIKHLISL
jgi:hypothetical protein